MTTPKKGAFADQWVRRERELGHPLCVGVDPHLDLIPALFRQGSMDPRDPRTVAAIEGFLERFLERVVGRVALIKPQIAFFERLGAAGLASLERLVAKARQAGLLVLLDAKRGDIGSTASAYAESYFGHQACLEVDALTVNPYLGLDSLDPFLELAGERGRGVFVLVRTSNPGSRDFQSLTVASGEGASGEGASGEGASGEGRDWTLFAEVARRLAPAASLLEGELGFSSLGVVVGATQPGDAPWVRHLLPSALFLVPGYGAQGGQARQAVAGLRPGPNGRLEGGLINSSRALLFPDAGQNADTAAAWERAIDQALDRAVSELAEAVA